MSPSLERTLVLLKPDALQRGLVGEIISRLERRGLKLVGIKMVQMDEAMARRHYAEHVGKPFFPGLVRFITSAPVVAMVWQGKGAVQVVRDLMGKTNPQQAAPGTIRGDLALDTGRNLIHGSDSVETAQRECALFFHPHEILDWPRSMDAWITEE
ncbi:MAG: nucleoside-diphosphate kinase [Dehalococcoidia bacterium]|nr:nucleoside-diphosphate kinase [Dehalococcoidia bacterium]MDW8119755.1 nucleoside-diphosphate kinase [Chloroflexota bacterium]